jgi:hypothetical protein
MNREELIKAIDKKIVKNLEESKFEVTQGVKFAGMLGFYEVLTSYLTQEQIDEIVKTHKLEL